MSTKLIEAVKLAREVIEDDLVSLRECGPVDDPDIRQVMQRYEQAIAAIDDALQAETPLFKVVTGAKP